EAASPRPEPEPESEPTTAPAWMCLARQDDEVRIEAGLVPETLVRDDEGGAGRHQLRNARERIGRNFDARERLGRAHRPRYRARPAARLGTAAVMPAHPPRPRRR